MQMMRRGALRIVPLLSTEADSIGAFLRTYSQMQFADACVARLSELLPASIVYTTDKRDCSVYRRNRNRPIKLITP